MRKSLLAVLCLMACLAYQGVGHGASLTVTWDGSNGPGSMGLDVDDAGGADDDYSFTFNGADHTSTTDFIVSDGTGVAIGDSDLTPDDFLGNGLNLFNGPFANLPNVDQLVLETDTPFTPITMSVNNTALGLEQIVYVNNTKDYAIIELRAVNNSATATPVFIAVANDWDIDGNSTDGDSDFDAARNMILQFDEPGPDNYSIGMASLNNPADQFLLGSCCGMTDSIDADPEHADPYVLQRHFLNNTKPIEECDDGGNDPADGGADTCSPKCRNAVAGEVCGNGTQEGDEECDDGNLATSDGCDDRCLEENGLCGNGALDPGEECDDGNRASGDGCSLECTSEFAYNDTDYCGDGIINNGATGFQADPSNNQDLESSLSVKFDSVVPGQGATAAFCIIGATGTDMADSAANLKAKADDCLAFYEQNIAVCGNGLQNAGEECDDGNTADNDGCDSNCALTGCGNDILNPGEECDDGNTQDGDGCSATCQAEGTCGDGVVDDGEECDDGNDNDNDLCNNACAVNPSPLFQGSGCGLAAAGGAAPWALSLWTLLGLGGLALRRRLQ